MKTTGCRREMICAVVSLLLLSLVRAEESVVESSVGTIKEKLQEIGANTQTSAQPSAASSALAPA